MPPRIIGQSIPRIDALGKVTGKANYSGDLSAEDMLFMKTLFAGRPHARVLDIKIDKAISSPGVVAVYTAKDVPVNEYGLQWVDQPVLCGPGSSNQSGDIVRFVGDQVAIVIAEQEAQAAAAIKLIEVDYEDLPIVSDPEKAMQPNSTRVHEEIGDSNIC
ncbi:MAG: aldehyde oxidase, partial [Anaerolineae bacterium]|nr:aldehyde oxidase [Anaerolineae bacterium]